MTLPTLIPIHNDIQPYAWGMPGGVSRALGWPETDDVQAELWLGAHPSSPARADGATFATLDEWEKQEGSQLPFLLKILTASAPLSLQAHPNTAQAAEGFAREDAAGIARDAFERNYKDPHAKPELIVALEDGFQALCGFRPIPQTTRVLNDLAAASAEPDPILAFRDLLVEGGVRAAVAFALSRTEEVTRLVDAIVNAASRDAERFDLVARIQRAFPNDDGIAFALLLNHVTLSAGESLWLPAGNVHAYLYGSGVELMGPSDNVLRGGLTPKHVDEAELMKTLVFEASEPPYLAPEPIATNVVTYRPASEPSGADVTFELWEVAADAHVTVPAAAIGVVTDGAFSITVSDDAATHVADRGSAFFLREAAPLNITGAGRLWIATSRSR